MNNTIHTAKLLIYKFEEGNLLFLVLKEPEGIYGFVGGAQDEEDKTIFDTAKRELMEEVRLSEQSCKIVETEITHEFMHTDPMSDRFGKKGVLHAFLVAYNGKEPVTLNKELLEYDWVTKDEVLEKISSSYSYLSKVFGQVLHELSFPVVQ